MVNTISDVSFCFVLLFFIFLSTRLIDSLFFILLVEQEQEQASEGRDQPDSSQRINLIGPHRTR